MLNIYCAGESVDKEKFIFEEIKKEEGNTILIVPDQFSAQSERNAFFYLGIKASMDLRILDFDRLGYKAVRELGVQVPELIDKYGRHMLLMQIISQKEKDGSLKMYKGMSEKNSFISLMNSMISELKRNNVTCEMLEEAGKSLDDSTYLKYKIGDIFEIYNAYEQETQGRYLDSEDYVTFYGDAVRRSSIAAGARVWIYGFDTFTARNLQVITRIAQTAECVNIVMNYEEQPDKDAPDAGFIVEDDRKDIFSLTGNVIRQIETAASEENIDVVINTIEGCPAGSIWSSASSEKDKIVLAQTTNAYEEAERAAAHILELVRDGGYRYSDISVICNDMQGLGAILGRTLNNWGIPAFIDQKRKVLHHPAVALVITLMDLAAEGFGNDSVMRLIKTGLLEIDEIDSQLLENYAYAYRIRGSRWREPFTKKGKIFGDDDLDRINVIRETVVRIADDVKASMGSRNSAGEKVRGLYSYLVSQFGIEERLEKLMDRQEEAGLLEASSETGQSWNAICRIFDQIVEIAGDRKLSNGQLKKLVTDGLEEMEIGLVPSSTDCVVIGTMQRTRLSRNRVLMVIGANDGILPMGGTEEALLSEPEIEKLSSLNINAAKTEHMMRGEETLAIYRNLSAPREHLYMSCSSLDSSGEAIKPSHIFENLKEFASSGEGLTLLGDLDDDKGILSAVTTPAGTIGHLADAVRSFREDGQIDEDWYQVIRWYLANDDCRFDKMQEGMEFSGSFRALDEKFATSLYMGDFKEMMVSASRLEKYSACPFAHFMTYGLKPERIEEYRIGASQTGDIYHECLMRFSQKLSEDGLPAGDERSGWMRMNEELCRRMITSILSEEMNQYGEGIMNSGQEEKYRVSRIADICTDVAMTLVKQVQKGQVKEMAFEKRFGAGEDIGPIRISVGDKTVLLRGIIDRMDILDTGSGQDAVRIVDYKTGDAEIRKEYYDTGYKLQLMVYMNAVLGEGCETLVPAGVFHFNIGEMDENDDVGSVSAEDYEGRRDRNYRLKGFVLNDEKIIRAMDREFSVESDVIPVKIKKDEQYAAAAKGRLFSGNEFRELCEQVDVQVKRICSEILSGNINAAPVQEGTMKSACTYCNYKSVCMFDTSFSGCRYVKC